MRLKYEFEIVDMGDEQIAVAVGKDASKVQGVLKFNKEGREIFELLKENNTRDSITNILKIKYENNQEDLFHYVNSVIKVLDNAGLIE